MRKIIYLPLEHIDMRYTVFMDEQIEEFLNDSNLNYKRIYPLISGSNLTSPDLFLNAGYTIQFKNLQLRQVAKMYAKNEVNDGDIIFVSDLWMPGLESIAYLNHFYKKDVKIRGILHAGSFTDTDEVRKLERWASLFENMIFDIVDKIYVASEFLKQDVLKKRLVSADKLIVTPFLLDFKNLDKFKSYGDKENIVIFNGRHHPEKQPEKFLELKQYFNSRGKNWKFIDTHELQLPKDEYYKLLAKSKVVVSFALQENFGFGIAEAVYLGCLPVLPNRLVYPEMYGVEFLYDTDREMKYKVELMLATHKLIKTNSYIEWKSSMYKWFN